MRSKSFHGYSIGSAEHNTPNKMKEWNNYNNNEKRPYNTITRPVADGEEYKEDPVYSAIMNNTAQSSQILQTLLSSGILNKAITAKENFTLSDADYKVLKAAFPNYNKAQLTNLIAKSPWANDFAGRLETNAVKDVLKGASLEDYLGLSESINDSTTDKTSAQINKQYKNVLKQLATNPAFYENLVAQQRADAVAGTTAGQRAANALGIAKANDTESKALADTLYEAFGGTGEDSVTGQTRSQLFNNLAAGYGGYTEQQLNKLATDVNMQSNDLKNLITILSLVNTGLTAEQAQAQREAADNAAKADAQAAIKSSKAEQEAKLAQAQANAAADYGASVANQASQIAGGSGNVSIDPSRFAYNEYKGKPVFNTPTLSDAPYIDENLYKTLLGDEYTKYLTEEAYNRFTHVKTEEELAKEYGLEDLMSQQSVADRYTGFQEQANKASDKVFNEAQRAYITAVAAGDVETADQLTKLAETASTTKKNLYGAAALSNQFNQQRKNSNIGTDMYYDSLIQAADNKAALDAAKLAGYNQWNTWIGDANANTAGNGFRQSFNKGAANAADANAAYGDLITGAINSQTGFNNILGEVNRGNNDRLTDYAGHLNSLNTMGATNNITNNATIQALKNSAYTQQQINAATSAQAAAEKRKAKAEWEKAHPLVADPGIYQSGALRRESNKNKPKKTPEVYIDPYAYSNPLHDITGASNNSMGGAWTVSYKPYSKKSR